MRKKRIFLGLMIVLLLWLSVSFTDFYRVLRFEKPVFCVLADGKKDGGSGLYRGVGYSFEIEGNFLPEDEFPGVTHFDAKLFGVTVKRGIRD